jgi:hypothetical protein
MGDLGAFVDQLLDWVHQASEGSVSTWVDVTPFAQKHDLEQPAVRQLIDQGARLGLLSSAPQRDGVLVSLTVGGLQTVQGRQQRRGDPGLRAAAARQGLLCWFYGQYRAGARSLPPEGVLRTAHAMVDNDPLTKAEIDRASGYLADKGLIEWSFADRYATITAQGIDCVERHGGQAVGHRGGAGRTMVVGTDPAALDRFIRALLHALPNLQLKPGQEAAVRAGLEEAQQEASRRNPELPRIVGPLSRAVGFLADAGKPVLTSLFLLLAQYYAGLPST